MNSRQLRGLVNETLTGVDLYSEKAEELLLLTIAVESDFGNLIGQIGGGPALGICQMEPATHDDIMFRWLNKPTRSALKSRVIDYCRLIAGPISPDVMRYNLKYAILLARLKYLACDDRLPDKDNLQSLAQYWKDNYNTKLGDGTVEKAIKKYRLYVVDKL